MDVQRRRISDEELMCAARREEYVRLPDEEGT